MQRKQKTKREKNKKRKKENNFYLEVNKSIEIRKGKKI